MLYNEYFIPAGFGNVQLAITENGIDCGTCSITGCNCQGGWQGACSSEWSGYNCESYYMMQLEWYDQVLRADDFVIGSTVFCIDIPNWGSFDITPIVPQFVSYLQSQ
jgi:hypothetical protein